MIGNASKVRRGHPAPLNDRLSSTLSTPRCRKLNVSAKSASAVTGLVVSDLHLFARRSIGHELMRELLPDLKSTRLLVLNGDIVDFRWSTCANHAETRRRSLAWLEELLNAMPGCDVHYVLGNHDCLTEFTSALSQLAATHGRFHWHEYHLQLGGLLFLHGDCTHRRMSGSELQGYRAGWSRSRRRGRAATNAYRVFDRLGVTRMVHRWHFPIESTLDRLTHHLDAAHDGWRQAVHHCYFGHTHDPFANRERDGVAFHNTGSAIRGMKFNPLPLSMDEPASPEFPTRSAT